jgi:hypothetical protein
VPLLVAMFGLTLAVQAVRVLAIWAAGKAVGVDLSPRPYYVMGPLLFLVMLVPFTVNGLAVRESFFVSFLGALGVDPDRAFATGLLFFVVTIALALPGVAIVFSEECGAAMSEASVVVVTYNALPWLEQALESVRGTRRSSSITVRRTGRSTSSATAFRTFDRRAGEPRPRLRVEHRRRTDVRPLRAAPELGRLAGRRRARGARLVRRRSSRGGRGGPRLRYPDGRLQRSVRGFPTLCGLRRSSSTSGSSRRARRR